MKVYFLQSFDYEPSPYGVFTSRENALEAIKKIETHYGDGYEIVTYELDKFIEEGWLDMGQSEVIKKNEKPKKWRA